jgi:hypothetical protein
MITGDDSVFFASGRAPLAVENFLIDLLKQWPDMRVSVEDDGDEAFRIWASDAVDLPQLPDWCWSPGTRKWSTDGMTTVTRLILMMKAR